MNRTENRLRDKSTTKQINGHITISLLGIRRVINKFENLCSNGFVSTYFYMIFCQNKQQRKLSRN